ncbi:MAG: hypothetical protein K6L76_10830 [Agarilytica sp.]
MQNDLRQKLVEADYIAALHLYGLNSRASGELLHTFALEDCTHIVKRFFETAKLAGFFRFILSDGNSTTKFGASIDRKFLDKQAINQACAQRSEKISETNGFIVFKSPLITIFLAKQHIPETQIAWIRDIVCLLLDTLHAWLENYMKRQVIAENLRNSLVDTIQASSELMDQHITISDELIANISSKFPALGLEEDQEDMILDIINSSCSGHVSMIEQQIRSNNTLGDTLLNAVDGICEGDLLFDKKDHLNDDGVELF